MALVDPDGHPSPVFVLSDKHPSMDGDWHSHRRLQLVHVSDGAVTVITRQGRFVVPRQRAVWIGPRVEHRISSPAPFWLTTCYIEPNLLSVPNPATVVAVDRLTDELLIAASGLEGGHPAVGPEARLIAVLLDRLPGLELADIFLPEPGDPKLRRLCSMLLAEPSRSENLGALAGLAGMTERTAARLFVSDTGMTFGQWRQCLRLQIAFEKLGAGASVTEAAFEIGYRDVSSFITAFKARFGGTPAKFVKR
ncbi:MAG TPA: helix-turn-helix transcriptional regulator [Brevundimonas sp.]